ncbi:LacI family DNA-binding transcriptional regulator [Microbacterium sp. ZW T2_14]|uniref:LacI family DNA-binding transcriptional regulator n=1 Tax=Microbacterium sp. ZW T2_14 TaxID=3378079 RepID=UPI0038529F6E
MTSRTKAGRATIHDIAADLGVSVSTVSRALTPGGTVSPETRRRVEEAAGRLDYRTNRAARSLSTGRMHSIGLIVPDLRDPFFAEVAKGAQMRARSVDHTVYIADTDRSAELEFEAIDMMRRDVDGFLVCAPLGDDDALREHLRGTAAVMIHRELDGLPSVTSDLASGIAQAVQHLHALGHRRIAHVAGPDSSWGARRRRAAFEREVADDDRVLLGPITDPFEGGVATADALLASGATAVVAYNDLVALGLVTRLRARGVSVPDGMSVVGFDGLDVATLATSLTSVAVPRQVAARSAVDLLLRALDEGGEPASVVLPTQLIVRDSTAPLLR